MHSLARRGSSFPPIFPRLRAWKFARKFAIVSRFKNTRIRSTERREIYSSQKLGSYLRNARERKRGRPRPKHSNRLPRSRLRQLFWEEKNKIFFSEREEIYWRIQTRSILNLFIKSHVKKIERKKSTRLTSFENEILPKSDRTKFSVGFFLVRDLTSFFSRNQPENVRASVFVMMQFSRRISEIPKIRRERLIYDLAQRFSRRQEAYLYKKKKFAIPS